MKANGDVIDYNGEGHWAAREILARYLRYAREESVELLRDLSPDESFDARTGRRWVWPVMQKVIDGIEAGDAACVRLGIEFIEEDGKFPFGKTLKSNVARALRRAVLSESQKWRIRARVFGMLRAGMVPHEYREYAKLVRRIGFEAREVPKVEGNAYVMRYRRYFEMVAAGKGHGAEDRHPGWQKKTRA